MANGSFKIKKSLNIEPISSPTLDQDGDIAVDSATNRVKVRTNSTTDNIVTDAGTQTLTNKTLSGNVATNLVSGAATITLPTTTGTLATLANAEALTNKTIDADQNAITNIENADIKALAAIDATKIADGSVTSTEFQYISTLTSNAQTQINTKITSGTGAIVNADVNASAAIDRSKLASGTASHVVINDGSGVLSSEAALDETRGGTGQTTVTTGDLFYGSASNTISKLAIGSSTQVLTVSGGVPTWATAGAGAKTVQVKTTTYTILSTDDAVLADASGGAFTLTLPSAASAWIVRVIKTDTTYNTVTVARAGSDTIGSAADTTALLQAPDTGAIFISDGTSKVFYISGV